MARKRIVEAPTLQSWTDVDGALREIAENELALGDIEAELNRQVIGAKKVADQDSKPHADRIAKLERDVKEYVEEHREDLGKRKARVLTFGKVGFRIATSIPLPRDNRKFKELIRRLKVRKMTDCIVVKESISKVNLRKYGKNTVLAVGGGWKQTEAFWYETDKEKLERQRSGLQ